MPRVLLVDDEKNVLKSLAIGLRRNAFEVCQARSGEEALRQIAAQRCDYVVSDVRMSPMDGYTLASRLQKMYPEVGIVLMSAFGFDDEQKRFCRAMDFQWLTKPFSVTELMVALKDHERRLKGSRVLVFSEPERCDAICRVVSNAGMRVQNLDEEESESFGGIGKDYDLFIIDGGVLQGNRWKALNAIDHHGPDKPVLLLSGDGGSKDAFSFTDLSITVLDRKRFVDNPSWAKTVLKSCLDGPH